MVPNVMLGIDNDEVNEFCVDDSAEANGTLCTDWNEVLKPSQLAMAIW